MLRSQPAYPHLTPTSNSNSQAEVKELAIEDVLTSSALTLNDVIIRSILSAHTSQQQSANIVNKFNERARAVNKTVFMHSRVRREQFEPGEYLLGHRNFVPEIVAYSDISQARNWSYSPMVTTEILEARPKQNAPYISYHGSHILNVPPGQFALARGNQNDYLIYGEGPHVIHDPTFQFDDKNGFVSIANHYIKHGPINILWVPAGKLALITVKGVPCLLPHQPRAYVFNDPTFYFNEQNGYVNEGDEFIQHGNITIIRVRPGKIAKVWLNNLPVLLESRALPYVFNNANFRLNAQNFQNCLEDAASKCIIHGSLKRLLPHTGEDIITYNNGKLVIYGPSKNNEPIIINSPTHSVDGFFVKTMQTLILPSEEAIAKNRLEKPEHAAWVTARTSDSLGILLQFLVTYTVDNPKLALKKLGKNGILPHIESLATADMTQAIQLCTAQQFLGAYQAKIEKNENKSKPVDLLVDAPVLQHCQQDVFSKLKKELSEYGITLTRLNIERSEFQNPKIAEEMAKQSLVAANSNARLATIKQETVIKRTEAEQEAETKRIQQRQINDAQIAKAQADLDSAKQRAETKRIEQEQLNTARISQAKSELDAAKMQADAKILIAKAEADAQTLRLQAQAKGYEAIGQALNQSPALAQNLRTEEVAKAISSIKSLTLTSQEFAPFLSNFWSGGNPSLLFNQPQGNGVTQQRPKLEVLDAGATPQPTIAKV